MKIKLFQDEHVKWDTSQQMSYLKSQILKNKEIGAEAVSFVVKNASDENGVPLGLFLIYWKR